MGSTLTPVSSVATTLRRLAGTPSRCQVSLTDGRNVTCTVKQFERGMAVLVLETCYRPERLCARLANITRVTPAATPVAARTESPVEIICLCDDRSS